MHNILQGSGYSDNSQFKIKWEGIILYEALLTRNHNTNMAQAGFLVKISSRGEWHYLVKIKEYGF